MFFTEVSRQTHAVIPADFFFPRGYIPLSSLPDVSSSQILGSKTPLCISRYKVNFLSEASFSLPGSHTEVRHHNSLTPETCRKILLYPEKASKHHKGIVLKLVLATRADCNEKKPK